MLETITAIYRNGALYPQHPLNLQDDQTVQITLVEANPPSLLDRLRDSGIVTMATPSEDPPSDQTLEAFVKTLPMTTIPTSETIIDDRLLQSAQLEGLQTANPNQHP